MSTGRKRIVAAAAAVFLVAGALLWWLQPTAADTRRHYLRMLTEGQRAFDKDSIFTAMDLFVKVTSMAEAAGDDTTRFKATVYTAMVYNLVGESDKSYDLLKGTRYVEVADSGDYASQYYFRLMALYAVKKDKDYKRSVAYNQRAIDLDRRLYHNENFVCQELSNIGETYLMVKDYRRAAEIAAQMRSIRTQGNTLHLSGLCYLEATLLLRAGQTDSAYAKAEEAMRHASHYHAYDNMLLNLSLLCQMDSIRGDIHAYIAHRNERERISANVTGGETRLRIASIQEQNRMALAEREQASQHRVQVLVVALLAVVVAALLIVIGELRKNYRARQRMTEMERESLDQTVERKRLENELLTLKIKQNETSLARAYKNSISLSETLAEHTVGMPAESLAFMETVMKDKEAAFLERTEARFPQLTYNDIRLMGFIRMGMTPHAIASALAISGASLTTARYRLRKKLKLDKTIVLEDFIAEI